MMEESPVENLLLFLCRAMRQHTTLLQAEFGFCPVPASAVPPDWRPRETPESQGQKRKAVKAESMATSEVGKPRR